MATGPMRGILRHLRRASTLRDAAELTDGQLLDRFLARRDDAAFEALVKRHGAMVLGVCRRVLGNAADAEDAFQATFLVLVRKAHAVRPRELVGNWLHGVAYRTALRARSAAAQRRAKERQVLPMPRQETLPDETWRDVQPLLDRELNGLPEKYRVPIVLCDLEGKARREAARQLGWPEGTLSCRLARGRALLARRLARYGLNLSGAGLALGLAQEATAAVPAALLTAVTRTALAGGAAAGVVLLAEGVIKAMLWTRLKVGAALVLALGMVVGGTGVLRSPAAAQAGVGADGRKTITAPLRKSAAPPLKGEKPARVHEVRGNDDLKEWVLDFRFHDPQLAWVRTPGRGLALYWYLRYEVSNRTSLPRTFNAQFELVLPGETTGKGNVLLPGVFEQIEAREDPNPRETFRHSHNFPAEPIPPSPPGGPPHAVQGLAIWEGVPPDVKELTIYVAGLTNVFRAEEIPGTLVWTGTWHSPKELRLHFRREGQEMRFVPPAEWVFREKPLAALRGKQPPRKAEDVEKQLILYLKALSQAHAELGQAMDAARKRDAVTRALRQIDDGLRALRRHTGSEQAELEALDEIERGLKELRRQRQDQRKALEKLQGLWLPKKLVFGGDAVPIQIVGSLSPPSAVAILGDRFLTRAGKDPQQVPTIRLHPDRKPAGIDFHIGGKVLRATYELQGDTLRIHIGDSALTYQRKPL
jgi:RNA polymerase sigma factor (sigma-70 family)